MLFESLLEALDSRAECQGDRAVFAFMKNGDEETKRTSFSELMVSSKLYAKQLLGYCSRGDRVLIMCASQEHFVASFFGCLYAGVIAVPVPFPRRNQSLDKIAAIVADCGAKLAVTDEESVAETAGRLKENPDLNSLGVIAGGRLISLGDDVDFPVEPSLPDISKEGVALLQYTSGSTGRPKGVKVSHKNIVANSEMIIERFGHSESSVMVSWLPLFHDMGLIGSVVQPVYTGFFCAMMPPGAFIQKPVRWLKAISRYRATTSGGPNFGYDLCVQRCRTDENLDLSSWVVAFNGAEPVRERTLREFAQRFHGVGFRSYMHLPCYGMAEATLLISAVPIHEAPNTLLLDVNALEEGRVVLTDEPSSGRRLVSCGKPPTGLSVRISGGEHATEARVGEIELSGENVTAGYWSASDEQHAGGARGGDGNWFKTGDAGFIYGNELYICGRIKDMIVLNGRNIYPQDIEFTVENSHELLQIAGSAAFSVEMNDKEELVVVQELAQRVKDEDAIDEIIGTIRASVSVEFEVMVRDVVLVPRLTIPKTSSGKVQRRLCREKYLSGDLGRVASV